MRRTYYLDFVCVDEKKCVKPISITTRDLNDYAEAIREELAIKNLVDSDCMISSMSIADINDWTRFDEFGFTPSKLNGYGLTYNCTCPTPRRIREVTDIVFKIVKLKNCVCLIKHVFIADVNTDSDPALPALVINIPRNNVNMVSDHRVIIKSSVDSFKSLEITKIII